MIQGASTLRDANLSMAFDAICTDSGMTRAELSRRLGMSRSTASSLVQELLDYDLIREDGPAESTSGRRAIMLRLNDQSWFVFGVDIGASHVTTLLMSLSGAVVSTRRERVDARFKPEEALKVVCEQAREIMVASSLSSTDILGMGVAVPAPVVPESGGAICEETMAAWRGIKVEEALQEQLQIQCLVDNDANLGALAEHWWGVGRHAKNMLFLKVATGVGCGMIVDGSLHRGRGGFVGELGHMRLKKSESGGLASLNELVGRVPLNERYKSLCSQDDTPSNLILNSNQTLISKAQAGDLVAQQVIQESGYWLGVAVSNIIHLLNPELIVIGGSLSSSGDLLLKPVQKVVNEMMGWLKLKETRVTLGRLGERDVATGGATLIIQVMKSDIIGWLGRMKNTRVPERANA